MELTKMIELIAQVAAKRIAKENRTKAESEDAIRVFLQLIWAKFGRNRRFLSRALISPKWGAFDSPKEIPS